MDPIWFAECCERTIGKEYPRTTVGLLSEKTLHAVLKEYFEPDPSYHEKKVGKHYADICRGEEIIEIQTRSFDKLRDKLSVFLQDHKVTVVHPIPARKNLIWIDPESGAYSEKRLVPKKGSFYDAGRELWRISSFLLHPNLTVCLMLIDMDEYRLQNGYGKDKKRGSERHDRIPTALVDCLFLHGKDAYESLFPQNLPSPFTAKEFRHAVKGGPRTAPSLLNVLTKMGIVSRDGMRGRAFLYRYTGKNANLAENF